MFKLLSDFFGLLFVLFLLLSPLFLLLAVFLIWKGPGTVRLVGLVLLLLVAYYRLNWISPWYVVRGSELVQEFKLYDRRFVYMQTPSLRWMESSNRLLILPSEEVVENPKSPYYTHLVAIDIEARQTYWLPTTEVNLDETKRVESLPTGPSKLGTYSEFSCFGFSLPILVYRIAWPVGSSYGWRWEKTDFYWLRKVMRESQSGPVVVELNQIVFNSQRNQAGASSRWVMEGKFSIVEPPAYTDPRVLVLGPFNTSQHTSPAILILKKSCSSSGNAGIVMTSERAKKARTVERTGVV